MTPPADTGHHVTPRWIPLYVCGHEMFSGVHNRHVIGVNELKVTVHAVGLNFKSFNNVTSQVKTVLICVQKKPCTKTTKYYSKLRLQSIQLRQQISFVC